MSGSKGGGGRLQRQVADLAGVQGRGLAAEEVQIIENVELARRGNGVAVAVDKS
jgi:hypothetical protein